MTPKPKQLIVPLAETYAGHNCVVVTVDSTMRASLWLGNTQDGNLADTNPHTRAVMHYHNPHGVLDRNGRVNTPNLEELVTCYLETYFIQRLGNDDVCLNA